MLYVAARKSYGKQATLSGSNILLTYVGPWRVDMEELTAFQKGAAIECLGVALRGYEKPKAIGCGAASSLTP